MNRRIIVSVLLLMMFFASVPALRVEATVAEKEGYVRIETTRATYFVNQTLIDPYGYGTFSGLFSFLDERFGKIMNITGWSSEKFYGQKLEVTVDPSPKANISDGNGGYGLAHIFWGADYDLLKVNVTGVAELFLHEMAHGITPPSIMTRTWLREGFACFLSNEVQVLFGDKSRTEVDEWYNTPWERYVRNGYVDFYFNQNRTIQEGYGSYITAWMLNNISETYGRATHERFFASLPDEYLYYMPSFSLSTAESSSYKYYFDSLIVGYYSLAAGTSLFSSFKSWGVKYLPNPITVVCLNGTRAQSHAYVSGVTVTLSAAGENGIDKIEYSFDQKTWNTYASPFLVSENRILYCRSTDSAGNTGPVTSISLSVESNSSTPPQPEPFPTVWVVVFMVSVAVAGVGLLVYFKKHKH
jgi:hypothetical protein